MPKPLALALLLAGLAAGPAAAGLPPEDTCPTIGVPPAGKAADAVPTRLEVGSKLSYDMLAQLRDLIPREIWQNRHVFFYPGMQMVIGGCHRRFPVPDFYTEATRRFHEQVAVDREGNLLGYEAGLPFPPRTIDPKSPDAAVKWAWNLEHRFRGAGHFGSFRIVDIPGRRGKTHTFKGFFFFFQTRHRSDMAASGYRVPGPGAEEGLWVAGGRFLEPFNARHLAWRQIRPEESHQRYEVSDRTFVYVPTMRKVRRAGTGWVDGMYTPRYRVAGDSGGGGIAIGGNEYSGPAAVLSPGSAESAHQTEHLPRGFTALALRPNAYVWRFRGEREVLAPLNVMRQGYPADEDREFGPHGLSVATDRWDVRWAVVLEGRIRIRNHDYQTLTLYIDYQTQQPLYAVTKGGRGRLLDVGMPVHRFSGDVMGYPGWPDGERADVFDPVAEIFYRVADDSGWRRESYNVRSTPAEERIRRRFTSTDFLVRGR